MRWSILSSSVKTYKAIVFDMIAFFYFNDDAGVEVIVRDNLQLNDLGGTAGRDCYKFVTLDL